MTTPNQTHNAPQTATPNANQAKAHEKPGEGLYFTIFAVLAVLTLFELIATYIPILKVPILIGIALAKAWLVVQYYMHLRYDSKIYTWVLMIPFITGVLLTLFIQPLTTIVR